MEVEVSMESASAAVIPAHIKRISRYAAILTGTSVIAAPPLLALYAASGLASHHPWLTLLHVNAAALDPAARLALFAVTLAAMAPMLWGLDQVRRLFQGYAAGEVFTRRAAARFGRFALALLLTAVTGPLAVTALSLVLSRLGTVTPPSGVISVSSSDIGLLLIASVIWVIASVLHAAAGLADENASFI
jgi:hypothetical protein